jgi:hypothetical protein
VDVRDLAISLVITLCVSTSGLLVVSKLNELQEQLRGENPPFMKKTSRTIKKGKKPLGKGG